MHERTMCRAAIAAAITLAGCGGARGGEPVSRPAPALADRVGGAAPVATPRPTTLRLTVSPATEGGFDGPSLIYVRGDRSGFVQGSVRIELNGERIVAMPSFDSVVFGAIECGDGWLFISGTGPLAYAADFTAPLTHLADLDYVTEALERHRSSGQVVTFTQRGRLAQVRCDGNGARLAWITDLQTRLGEEPVDHWIGSSGSGLVVLSGGALLFRRDWGSAWTRLPSLAPAIGIALCDPSIVRTAEGAVRIGEDGTPRLAPDCTDPPRQGRAPIHPADLARIQDHLGIEFRMSPGVALENGRRAWMVGSRVAIEEVTGALLTAEVGEGCHPQPWGARLALRCPSGTMVADVVGFPPTIRITTLAESPGIFRFAGDGIHAYALYEPHRGDLGCDGVCVVNVERSDARPIAGVEGLRDDLDMQTRGDLTVAVLSGRVVVVSAERAALLEVPDELQGMPIRISPDGALWGVRHRRTWPNGGAGDGEIMTVLFPRGREVVVPPGTIDVGWLDAAAGVAVGRTLDDVHATVDGGRTWTPLPPANIVGDPRAVDLQRRWPLECNRDRCTLGARVWIEREPLHFTEPWREHPIMVRHAPYEARPQPAVESTGPRWITCLRADVETPPIPRGCLARASGTGWALASCDGQLQLLRAGSPRFPVSAEASWSGRGLDGGGGRFLFVYSDGRVTHAIEWARHRIVRRGVWANLGGTPAWIDGRAAVVSPRGVPARGRPLEVIAWWLDRSVASEAIEIPSGLAPCRPDHRAPRAARRIHVRTVPELRAPWLMTQEPVRPTGMVVEVSDGAACIQEFARSYRPAFRCVEEEEEEEEEEYE